MDLETKETVYIIAWVVGLVGLYFAGIIGAGVYRAGAVVLFTVLNIYGFTGLDRVWSERYINMLRKYAREVKNRCQ